ncbi:ubiquinol-cytochrome c reductase iron-sulfur subunit [Marinicrinis lubricantis]|uniref:Ubiquinol-cytochrome c reductase iron-sulfur subunit n=1 Tax=Marinicrinis lubricantis TaxID=2086470 RepID=A0ABW1IM24_9BACL
MTEEQKDLQHPQRKTARREMSRRQFLSYTLGGTGAFMVGVPILYNLRFAVDPLLQKKEGGEWHKVIEANKVTEEPQSIKFKVHVVDGWYESEQQMEAWIAKDANGNIFALSPVCKHLGCTVNWNGNPDYQNQYYCPCHGAHYTVDGKQLAVASAPLDEYTVRVDENGWVYLGDIKPNTRVK